MKTFSFFPLFVSQAVYMWFRVLLSVAILLVCLQVTTASTKGPLQIPQPVSLSASESDSPHHDMKLIKNTLDFVAMTVNHSLEAFGGDTLKILKSDTAIQDQLQTLAVYIKGNLLEIDTASSNTTVRRFVRRQQSNNVSSLLDDMTVVNAASLDVLEGHTSDIAHATRGLRSSLTFVASTLKHTLNMVSGELSKKLYIPSIQTKLHALSNSVKSQLLGIVHMEASVVEGKLRNAVRASIMISLSVLAILFLMVFVLIDPLILVFPITGVLFFIVILELLYIQ